MQERAETLEQSADKVRSKLLELQSQKGELELQVADALEKTAEAQVMIRSENINRKTAMSLQCIVLYSRCTCICIIIFYYVFFSNP